MAKPRELYSGQAPQAMSLMGQGIADAYANAGRIEGQGYQALGQGIAQGITAAASAYAGYKQQQSQAKAYEGFLNNELGRKALGINAETAKGYIKAAKDMGGPEAQIQFYQMGIPGMMQQNFKMQQIQAANPVKPAPSYPAITFEDSPLSSPTPSPAPSGGMMVGPNLGDDMAPPPVYDKDQTDYIDFMKKKGWAGGPVKQAWIDEYNDQRAFPQPLPRKR